MSSTTGIVSQRVDGRIAPRTNIRLVRQNFLPPLLPFDLEKPPEFPISTLRPVGRWQFIRVSWPMARRLLWVQCKCPFCDCHDHPTCIIDGLPYPARALTQALQLAAFIECIKVVRTEGVCYYPISTCLWWWSCKQCYICLLAIGPHYWNAWMAAESFELYANAGRDVRLFEWEY